MTPFLFTVIPAATNQTASHLVDVEPTKIATVDVEETHLIHARDKFGNLQDDTDDTFTVKLTSSEGTVVNGVVVALSAGIFQTTYTLTEAGSYTLDIEV
jgi:hypothetical protein